MAGEPDGSDESVRRAAREIRWVAGHAVPREGLVVTRSTLARRYAPLVALAVLQLLIIGFVPSKAAKSGSQVSAGAGNGRTATAATGKAGGAASGSAAQAGGP